MNGTRPTLRELHIDNPEDDLRFGGDEPVPGDETGKDQEPNVGMTMEGEENVSLWEKFVLGDVEALEVLIDELLEKGDARGDMLLNGDYLQVLKAISSLSNKPSHFIEQSEGRMPNCRTIFQTVEFDSNFELEASFSPSMHFFTFRDKGSGEDEQGFGLAQFEMRPSSSVVRSMQISPALRQYSEDFRWCCSEMQPRIVRLSQFVERWSVALDAVKEFRASRSIKIREFKELVRRMLSE